MVKIWNHQFRTLTIHELPPDIYNNHIIAGPGIFDDCKYCNKCKVTFIFVIIDENNHDQNYDNCYFYLNGKEIFKDIYDLNQLDCKCEEIQIKLLLE